MNEFNKYLVSQAPKFDKKILEDFEPVRSRFKLLPLPWFATQQAVRKLSEGNSFKPDKPVFTEVNAWEDFIMQKPKVSQKWKGI